MSWFIDFLTSSLGRKLVMSLTGLFLCSFLAIHLLGNLQLLKQDGGIAFNEYAYFMTHNPLIKTTSYLLYFSILLHAILGIAIWSKNKSARPAGYELKKASKTSFASRNMALLGTLIFAFIGIHLAQFWAKMKFTNMPERNGFKDLYTLVNDAYQQEWIVVFYVVSMIILGYHLYHGFESAFQTLGLNHKKYNPLIKAIGTLFSIIVPLLFAIIPVYMYFVN